MDGTQIFIYKSLNYISALWRKCCNIHMKPNMFQTQI